MILEEKHQQIVKEIIQRNRTKKTCNKCYDRGFIGFTTDKTIIPCEKCVDTDAAMEEWKKYVAGDESLKEHYKEFFDEDLPVEEESTEKPEEEKAEEKPEEKTAEPVEVVKKPPAKPRQPRKTETKTTTAVKPTAKTAKASPVRKTSARGK